MLELREYNCLGEALRDALDRWPDEICLIEADRDRENVRLTYRQFEAKRTRWRRRCRTPACAGERVRDHHDESVEMADFGICDFFCGGVLVPLDYKLTATEQLELLAHSKARSSGYRISPMASNVPSRRTFRITSYRRFWSRRRPPSADLAGAKRWEDFRRAASPIFVPRKRKDAACIVYSSGTGGRPKGCVLTHENYLEQCSRADFAISLLARRALPQYPSRPITPSISWWDLSARLPAEPQWCICGRCVLNTSAKHSRDTRLLT